jgi:hypothetical protein
MAIPGVKNLVYALSRSQRSNAKIHRVVCVQAGAPPINFSSSIGNWRGVRPLSDKLSDLVLSESRMAYRLKFTSCRLARR